MSSSLNPIAADITRKGLVENDRQDAIHNDASASRAALDAEELRELEHSLYYTAATLPADPAGTMPAPSSARRSLIDRIFRRR